MGSNPVPQQEILAVLSMPYDMGSFDDNDMVRVWEDSQFLRGVDKKERKMAGARKVREGMEQEFPTACTKCSSFQDFYFETSFVVRSVK